MSPHSMPTARPAQAGHPGSTRPRQGGGGDPCPAGSRAGAAPGLKVCPGEIRRLAPAASGVGARLQIPFMVGKWA